MERMTDLERLGEVLDLTILSQRTEFKDILEDMKKMTPEELRELEEYLKNTDKESYNTLKLLREIHNF